MKLTETYYEIRCPCALYQNGDKKQFCQTPCQETIDTPVEEEYLKTIKQLRETVKTEVKNKLTVLICMERRNRIDGCCLTGFIGC